MDTTGRCPECEPVVLRMHNSGRLESCSVFERIGTQGASAPLKRQVDWSPVFRTRCSLGANKATKGNADVIRIGRVHHSSTGNSPYSALHVAFNNFLRPNAMPETAR